MSDRQGWVGVDLDGTLAEYHGWQGMEHIGEPIGPMCEFVHRLIANGREVRIFTARVHDPDARPYIEAWLERHGFPPLQITNVKDFGMIALFDDRCCQVAINTGKIIGSPELLFERY